MLLKIKHITINTQHILVSWTICRSCGDDFKTKVISLCEATEQYPTSYTKSVQNSIVIDLIEYF